MSGWVRAKRVSMMLARTKERCIRGRKPWLLGLWCSGNVVLNLKCTLSVLRFP